jgi:hypothetical protein
MPMSGRHLMIVVAACAAALPAQAESSSEAVRAMLLAQAAAEGDLFDMAAGTLAQERVVKGAPYCAEAVHETVQWLADAGGGAPNRIVRSASTRLCRDGEGRTWQEVDRGGSKLVYLRDPVAREAWALNPQRKTARRLGERYGVMLGASVDSSLWRDYAERMREWAREMAERARGAAAPRPAPPTPPAPPAPPAPGSVFGSATPALIARDGGDAERSEVRVMRWDSRDAHATFDAAVPPPPVRWRVEPFGRRGPGVVQALPAREIEGLRVHGERTSWTIEAGKVGNERPIQIVREVWTSPELMLTVQVRDFDPRSGEVNYRLKDLRRGEPDAALMRVPADYGRSGAPRAASAPRG